MAKNALSEVSVFLSYKKKDKKAAQKLATELGVLGRPRLVVFVAEKLKAGEEWTVPIHKNLRAARVPAADEP